MELGNYTKTPGARANVRGKSKKVQERTWTTDENKLVDCQHAHGAQYIVGLTFGEKLASE